ncbi:MAG: glycoside hydrolase family 15 protein [Vicinamibacterales bacterium]
MSTRQVTDLAHGAIGNGRVLALVNPDTGIDWLCLPRFDSPSVFARLLDEPDGGTFRFDGGPDTTTSMTYVANTNVLRTEVGTADGRCEVLDFAPRLPAGLSMDAPLEVHRLVRPLSGTPRLRVVLDPRPEYAAVRATLAPTCGGVEIRGGSHPLFLDTNLPLAMLCDSRPFRVERPYYFALGAGRPPDVHDASTMERALDLTIAGWDGWSKTCALPPFRPEVVLRSALCLKLHQYRDTGAIIAAATTSIPEALGTPRTWDYRYCWLRDSAFVVEALRRLSQLIEGERFMEFLLDVADSGPLQPLYGVGGERDLAERTLPHLAGFAGNGPVRVGNAAYAQAQHDIMGELLLCLDTMTSDPRVGLHEAKVMPLVERLVAESMAASTQEDTGLWEYRAMPRHYTFSKVLCWVAASRGADMAERHGRTERAGPWRRWADAERERVLAAAYNDDLGFFTQVLEGRHPDASNLLLPTLGILDAHDPRFVSTVRAYETLLAVDGLLRRYAHDDDFGQTTSAFTICSFWYAEALAMVGRVDEAVRLFDTLVAHANPLGLFSEDIEPETGRLLGNFPQTYTHVGLIHAAITIAEVLDARHGRFRAWNAWPPPQGGRVGRQ